jgi:hypothetical protein
MGRSVQKAVDNVRKLSGANAPAAPDAPALKTGDVALRKPLAQSPNTSLNNADDGLPISVVRNLIYSGAPEDLAQLRQIVDGLSDRGKANLMASIARETRDPRSPAKSISLTPEGKMLMDATFNGIDPDASWIANKPVTPGGGTRLDLVSAEADLEPKTFRPEWKSDGRRELKDDPSFRSTEEVKENKDGTLRVKHTDQHYDGQTANAIERAEQGLPVGPIYDDAANTPRGSGDKPRPPGKALAAGTQTPKQEATRLMHRLAQTSNPHGVIDSVADEDYLMFSVADRSGGDQSAFAPGNTGSKMKKHMATVRPADHSDAMRAFTFVKKGEFSNPNQQFNSAEDFARAFVESVDQEGLNVTPVTARERADATGMIDDYSRNPDAQIDRIVNGDAEGDVSPATVGRMMRENMSDTVRATKTAERSVMQEQAIASLARKFDEIFGHQGWGENYKPSTRPGTSEPAAPAGGIGEGVSTTQDPAQVPGQVERLPMQEGDTAAFEHVRPNQRGTVDADGRPYSERVTSYEQEKNDALRRIKQGDPDKGTGYFDPSHPLVATPQAPKKPLDMSKPGMEIGEDVDADDLADLHNQRVGGEGDPISTEEVEPNFARGRDLGDRTGMGRTKTKELPGHKRDAYNSVGVDAEGNRKPKPDGDRSFAEYNRENRVVSDSDLERRRQFAEQWNRTVGGETERSSVLRQQLRELLESNEPEAPGTRSAAARASQIADLQRRLVLAERLDAMSGVHSMRTSDPETGMIVTPQPSSAADLQSGKLAASARPLEADEIELPGSRKFDLDNEPIDAEFEVKRPDDPAIQEALPGPAKKPDVEPESGWKKAAKRGAVAAGVLGGGLGIYELLRRAGQPPANGGPPVGGDQLGPPPGPGDSGPNGPGGYVPYVPGGTAGQDLGAKPEDRIRALQNFQMNLNPRTQILQSYVR